MVAFRTLFDSNIGDVSAANVTQVGTLLASNVIAATNVAVSGTVLTNNLSVSGTGVISGNLGVTGTIAVGGLGIMYAVNPSINLTTATSAFVAAMPLTAAVNVVISASFTSASPVSLPSVATWMGGEITVLNQSTMTVAVWPQSNDIIDATATGAYVKLDAGKRCSYFAVSATGIISAQWGVTSV